VRGACAGAPGRRRPDAQRAQVRPRPSWDSRPARLQGSKATPSRALRRRKRRREPPPASELGAHRVAVSVGRLVASKRVDKVIDYVSRTATVERLVVVGDGPERSRLEGLASRLGVEVEFLGMVSRSRALAWIGAADVLVHASEAEGSSTVVREAEALGTRVEWI